MSYGPGATPQTDTVDWPRVRVMARGTDLACTEVMRRITVRQVRGREPGMNTIQMVLDHTPNEIAELEESIALMEERLRDSRARKQLLEQLLAVAQQRMLDRPAGLTLVYEDEPQPEPEAVPLRVAAGARP